MAMEDFAVTRTEKGSVSVLHLSGKMDHHTAPVFENALKALREEKRFKIILNLGDLKYISSAGLNVIMKFIDDIRQHGGDIIISNVLPGVYRVFNLVGYTQLYKFFDDMEKALEVFNSEIEDNS
jgi:anti-anti-sigma factor